MVIKDKVKKLREDRSISKNKVTNIFGRTSRASAKNQNGNEYIMSIAAEALYNDYCTDKELTAFSDLDIE